MKKLILLITSILIVSVNLMAQNSVWMTINESQNVPQMRGDKLYSQNQELNSVLETYQITNVQKVFPDSKNQKLQNVYQIDCNCNEVELLQNLTNKSTVVSKVEIAPKFETLELPNDYTSSFSNNWALSLINAEGAWSYTTGDTSVRIAISDQNFYQNHEELVGKVKYYDVTNTSTKTHGTAVAITAAGNTNNSTGISSIGYNSSLGLFRMNYNDMLKASYNGYKVINLSWASGCTYNYYAQLAIDEVWNNGTFIVASAGNGSTCGGPDNLVYPAAYNHVFSVTSVGQNDSHISQNGSTHQHNSTVDICAPGYNVPLSAAPGWYSYSSGTSFAAPYVSGTIALMLSVNPNITNSEIDSILRITAVDIYSINPQYLGKLGSGRLNSAEAVRIAYEMTLVIDNDNNNGHGNSDGFDPSNPGYDNSQLGSQNGVINNNSNSNNGNGQGNNGNHFNTLSDSEFSVYPNPNNGIFNIANLPSDSKIFDSVGSLVTEIRSNDIIVSISTPGQYYLINQNKTIKIIIQ
jgi:subtilisin family serine protease